MSVLTVRPLNTGVMALPRNVVYHDTVFGIYSPPERLEGTPVFTYLIEGGEKLVLVDTGMSDTEYAHRYHFPSAFQPEGVSIIDQLKKLGYAPEDIGCIVLTHLHWDHCFYLNQFTKARFFAHPEEIAFSKDPIPMYYASYDHPSIGVKSQHSMVCLEPVMEGDEIIPGVKIMDTPGHSPGHIAVCVSASSGEYICAGDALMNLDNLKEVQELRYDISPPGRFTDIVDCWKSIRKIRSRLQSIDHLLITHDKNILGRIEKDPILR